ncbi:MAG: pyridoxal phosphate-dependent aminotransferase [Paracoccaceae bacterium]
MFTPSKRSAISPFLAMDVLRDANAAEQQGRSVVHLEVGQPGAPAPKPVLEAARRCLETGRLGYTDALGIRDLRERIAQHYAEQYGVTVPADWVVVTTGSSGGFNLAFLAAFDVGDKVGLPTPGYPAYRNILAALGIEVVDIETTAADRWTLTEDNIRAAHAEHGLAGVLVASPANPSGTMLTPDALQAVCRTCDELGIGFISDEIYHGLTYEGDAHSALQYSDHVIVINSFSKYYCMTGWRIGWMILPEHMVRPVECLAQNLFISSPELSQRAALAAFDARDELEEIKRGYARNREILTNGLRDMGLDEFLPVDGAFYVYVNCRKFTNDTVDFCRRMLAETGVATTPGADFDPERGHQYMRLSFAGTQSDMKEALARMAAWLPTQQS